MYYLRGRRECGDSEGLKVKANVSGPERLMGSEALPEEEEESWWVRPRRSS